MDRPRIEKVWDEFSVAFSVTPEWAHSGVGQLMLISGVNLVGRFCRKLTFQKSLSDVKRIVPFPLIGVGGNLLESCLEIARSINPTMETRVVDSPQDVGVCLNIGGCSDITIASDGWFAYLNWYKTPIAVSDDQNPFGALMASCMGSAEVFRRLLDRIGTKGSIAQRKLRDVRFSTLDYSSVGFMLLNPPFPEKVILGDVLFVGCGAVSNGAIGALYQVNNLNGSFGLLDDETISLSNIGRYYVATTSDVGKRKPDVLGERLLKQNHRAHVIYTPVESLTTEDVNRYSFVFSGLDNRNNNRARFFLQNLLPSRIVHAATQGLGVAVANIDFAHSACLGCLYSPRAYEITTISDPSCGGVVLNLGNTSVSASVSFVSTACGVLAASELIKLAVPELREFALDNYLSLSLMSPDLADVRHRNKESHCICLCSEPFRQQAFRKDKKTLS